MACAALKRPHNFDLLSANSPEISGSPKRRRCGALMSTASHVASVSPFLEVTPRLCRDDLSRNVHDEWRRIQRRRRITCPSSPPNNSANLQSLGMSTSSNMQSYSPTHNSNWVSSLSPNFAGSSSPSRVSTGSMSPPRGKEQPTLTVKQVVLLCERLWKEREDKLREEYDQVLHERLTDQYDSFLKFTQDQIMRRYQQSSCSYVS